MKTFVIAMDNEAQCVISNLTDAAEERVCGRRVIRGKLNGEDALVVVSGVGKTNSAAAAQLAIQLSGAKRVYNIGVAGGLTSDMKVGDLYELKSAVQYDFDLTMLNGTEMGTLNERKDPYIPCTPYGRFPQKILGTGDRFNDNPDDYALLLRLGCGLRDMEGAAVAHVCETAGVELISIKCVSDVHGNGSTPGQYFENLKKCLAILTDFVKSI